MKENKIGDAVVNAALCLHKELGPGLQEVVYEVTLAHDLTEMGFSVERQVVVPICYKGIHFEEGFRADIIVDDCVILELKSVEQIHKAHLKQLNTYLRLKNMRLGYVLNFGAALMKEGIKRVVNGLYEES